MENKGTPESHQKTFKPKKNSRFIAKNTNRKQISFHFPDFLGNHLSRQRLVSTK